MNTLDLISKLQAIAAELDTISERADYLKSEKATLEGLILDDFIESGVQTLKTRVGTAFIERRLRAWTRAEDHAAVLAVCPALHSCVTESFSSQKLSAWAKALDEGDDGLPLLPASLAGLVRCEVKTSLRFRKV
jgi:hypothetical protein